MSTIVLIQPDIVWEDAAATIGRVRGLLAQAPPPRGALVVLPEMYAVGFSMNVAAIHEGDDRPGEAFLAEVARQYGVTALGGVVTRGPDGRGRNEAVAIGPDGQEAVRYAKLHPFSYAGEDRHYTAGDAVATFAWEGFTVAPFVCYDLRFPEIYRAATAQGADLLVTIANWPRARIRHWTSLLVARAIENQAYAVGVNRCGDDPTPLSYPGRSLVVAPEGDVLADAGETEGLVAADVSPDHVRAYRERLPFLKDMRLARSLHAL